MKIPTQIWIFCVGIFLQHYTFLQKRTFCILCEKFFHFVRKATIMGSLVGMLKKKKFMTYSHENMLFVNPPLIITEEQIREEMVKMDEVLTYVDNELI